MLEGNLYVISAPSGAGKTSLVNALAQSIKTLKISLSHTTREQRIGEQNGINYNFVSVEVFKELIDKAEFLEYAEIYGNYYGTSKNWVQETLKKGLDVVLEIDWQGAIQIRKLFNNVFTVFILPPSLEVLWSRLNTREQDKREVIERRIQMAKSEITHYKDYDYIICNDRFEDAFNELKALVVSNRMKLSYQERRYADLIKNLLNDKFQIPPED